MFWCSAMLNTPTVQYKNGLMAATIKAAPNHGRYSIQAVAITNNDTETETTKLVDEDACCLTSHRKEEKWNTENQQTQYDQTKLHSNLQNSLRSRERQTNEA